MDEGDLRILIISNLYCNQTAAIHNGELEN